MTDLVEFVKARNAEDRAAAEAATPGPWKVQMEIDGVYAGRRTVISADDLSRAISRRRVVTVGQTRIHWQSTAEGNVAHIVRQDPAATLARCDFFDWLIEQHPHDNEGDCDPCWPFLCPLDRAAAIWASHPDYRQEWMRNGS